MKPCLGEFKLKRFVAAAPMEQDNQTNRVGKK
jgi:hypothetical protein